MSAVLDKFGLKSMRVLTGGLLLVLFLAGQFSIAQSRKQSSAPSEYLIKAVMLVRFLKFVDWPEDMPKSDTIVIRVIGKDPLDEYFESSLNRKINGMNLEIRRHKKYKEGMILDDCHLLFISRDAKRETEQILEATKGLPMLTVGESKDFLDDGGMINFVTNKNVVRFEINQRASNEVHLRIRSDLLRRATKVIRKGSE